MEEIFVLVERREGEIREVTSQMLWKAALLCKEYSYKLTAVMLGEKGIDAGEIAKLADKVLLVEDDRLKNYNSDLYASVLNSLLKEHKPYITIIGHTPWGMDIGPALSIRSGFPISTDCVDLLIEDGKPKTIRQVYTGKLLSKIAFKEAEGYIATIRPGSFTPDEFEQRGGEIVSIEMPPDIPEPRSQWQEYVDTGAGDVDITQADLLVSIGRGIAEEDNIDTMKELAEVMGGTVSCSRPVVDKNWLPKFHQVGTSGKSVKPKVYFAFGISGAFQHVAGISGAGTIIAVNKDQKAPIFRVADYGVVEDLFKIVDALKEKMG